MPTSREEQLIFDLRDITEQYAEGLITLEEAYNRVMLETDRVLRARLDERFAPRYDS